MNVDIEELFAPGGALSVVDPAYEHRPQQAKMAAAVFECLEEKKHLAVEAGTGVGKSLAYLIPAALWAASGERRVFISTYTRALQEQLLDSELPVAAEILKRLGFPLRSAMLMGADNYLCAQRLAQVRSSPELFNGSAPVFSDGKGRPGPIPRMRDEAKILDELEAWSKTASSGHRSGLPCLVPQQLWQRVSRDPDLCLGQAGSFWNRCLFRKDRERAERAHILIINHALLLSGARLPSCDALIIDEAHNLEESAVSRFGLSVSQGRYGRVLGDVGSFMKRLGKADKKVAAALKKSSAGSKTLFADVAEAHGLSGFKEEPVSKRLAKDKTFTGYEPLKDLEGALQALSKSCADAEQAAELKMHELRVAALRLEVLTFLGGEKDGLAHWVESSQGRVELRAAPLEVGSRLTDALYSRGIPVIMTSATLSSGEGLGQFKNQVGFSGAREVVLDSPFDYESQAALLVIDDLPQPQDEPAFSAAVAEQCRRIIAVVPGGLFLLFSSWKMLRRVHELLKGGVGDRPLWAQGMTGSEELLERFVEEGNAVLLGVDTFWQGVDVPGDALSCVVLAKLPFSNFGSPMEEARREYFEDMGRNYFGDHSLPRAVMKFRQGFGRLIRSSADRGAVVILDSRILHRGYGSAFLEALPRCAKLGSVDDLARFFKKPLK